MLYSCTHFATVGVKGLGLSQNGSGEEKSHKTLPETVTDDEMFVPDIGGGSVSLAK